MFVKTRTEDWFLTNRPMRSCWPMRLCPFLPLLQVTCKRESCADCNTVYCGNECIFYYSFQSHKWFLVLYGARTGYAESGACYTVIGRKQECLQRVVISEHFHEKFVFFFSSFRVISNCIVRLVVNIRCLPSTLSR